MARFLGEIQAGRQVRLGQGRAQTQILRQAADVLGEAAILVQIERDLDVGSYVPLSIAMRCGPEVLSQTAEHLRGPTTSTDGWQGVIGQALRGKFLLVDGLEHLQASRAEWELPGLYAPSSRSLSTWLEQRAAMATLVGAPRYALRPVEDSRWTADRLWELTERDPERYALAVAREIMLGPGERRGWDEPSLMADLWDGMPLELRELISLLATHGRPIQHTLFEELELLSVESIKRARDLALIDVHEGQISLPQPWYGVSGQGKPVKRHRILADAFAHVARGGAGHPNHLAVLEAHRHYAAIPDIEQALEFADFSVGPLLESAVRQSKQGYPERAVQSYEALLELDERCPGRLERRTRAYAKHYCHYNQALMLAERSPDGTGENIEETIAGYRSALTDWPENALFWSRLVRKLFDASRESEAMEALRAAYVDVPPHPERDRSLIVNTVDRLIARNLLLPAVFVWGGHEWQSGSERAVEERLEKRLASGFQTTRLWAPGVAATQVNPPAHVTALWQLEQDGWICSSGELHRNGETRTEAVSSLVRALAFDALATRWREETGGLSVMRVAYQHPAYQQILSFGPRVVPEILRLIERQPDHWHDALVRLTGETPVQPGEKMTTSQLCARWVTWGKARGMRW